VNPSASGIHLVPYNPRGAAPRRHAHRHDPRATPLARQADIHLPVRPGTDLPIALSIHRYLLRGSRGEAFLNEHARGAEQLRERAHAWTFERAAAEADVPVDTLRPHCGVVRLDEACIDRAVGAGNGNRKRRKRFDGDPCAAAVAASSAARGGYTMSNTASWGITNKWAGAANRDTRRQHESSGPRAPRVPPTRRSTMLFVYNSNPAATTPDRPRASWAGARRVFTVCSSR